MPALRSFDGTHIHYESHGSGHPIIMVNGLACDANYWKYTRRHFGAHAHVINYDLRGHGKSGHPARREHVEVADHARDLIALISHLGAEKPVIMGFSLGVQIMFESYRQFGNNLGGLVAVTGPYRNPLSTFYGLPLHDRVIEGAIRAARAIQDPLGQIWPHIFRNRLIYPISRLTGATRSKREDMDGFYKHAECMHVPLFIDFAAAATRHSAEDVLPTISIPTLVIGGEKDTFTPVSLSEHMARTIPDAEYLFVKGGTHTALVEEPELINTTIERFLRDNLPYAVAGRRTADVGAEKT
jgi:3-oxoadipate enol-lactonase